MPHEPDFLDHASARWPGIVRTLVLLGCPEEHVARVARSGLARSHRGWSRAARHHDPDVHVYSGVLDAFDVERRRAGVQRRGVATPDPAYVAAPAPVETVVARVALERELDRLTPQARAMAVLHFVAGLDEQQVAGVLGVPVELVEGQLVEGPPVPGQPTREAAFHAAADTIGLPPAPATELLAEAGALRRRRRAVSLASLGVVAAVLGLGVWWGARPEPAPEQRPPSVTQQTNPAGLAWWANNVLYLDHVAVTLPRVEDLVEVGDGAVVGDRRGDVTFVDADGSLTTLGHKRPAAPLVASAERGWVAWVDPREDSPTLIVHDLGTGEVVARQDLEAASDGQQALDEGSRPIALDGSTLYYATPAGDWRWELPDGEPVRLEGAPLVDAAGGVLVRQEGEQTLGIARPSFAVDQVVAGTSARLSPDGFYALSRTASEGRSALFGEVLIHDTRTGASVWTGLTAQDVAVAAALGPDGLVDYVIVDRGYSPRSGEFIRLSFSAPYELRRCDLVEQTCTIVAKFPHTGALPVLAR